MHVQVSNIIYVFIIIQTVKTTRLAIYAFVKD